MEFVKQNENLTSYNEELITNAMQNFCPHSDYLGYDDDGDAELALFIKNNYTKLTEQELHDLFLKCAPKKYEQSLILLYDLKYTQIIPHQMDLEQFIANAQTELETYQWKACGFYIEDDKWLVTKEFTIHDSAIDSDCEMDDNAEEEEDNTIYMINSVPNGYATDTDTNLFVKLMTKRLNSLASNINVVSKKRATKSTTWLLFVCVVC